MRPEAPDRWWTKQLGAPEFSDLFITGMIAWSSGWQVGHIIYPLTFPNQSVVNCWAKDKKNCQIAFKLDPNKICHFPV